MRRSLTSGRLTGLMLAGLAERALGRVCITTMNPIPLLMAPKEKTGQEAAASLYPWGSQ